MGKLVLQGRALSVEALARAARGDVVLALAPEGMARMRESRKLVDHAIAGGIPVYGVTTGLGARATEALDVETLTQFSLQTLRGRAHAIGEPDRDENIRASMIVRLNTLLTGYSGARPEVAQHLCDCLNAGLVPVVGRIGSIGGGDLVLNATVGLALLGEGEMRAADGSVGPGDQVMRAAGIAPLELAPRDGLALANHGGYAAGAGALALEMAELAYDAAQTAAALSLEGFRANLTPLDARALAVKPLPGQQGAAQGLRALLEGSALFRPGAARRLQDPLSLRNVVQVHGGVHRALSCAREIVEIEINGASDNPIALIESGEIISCGAYFTTELALALEGVSRAFVHLAMTQLARIAKLLDPDFSGLPLFLAQPDSGSNAFAPVLKPTEDLVAELVHAASPVPVWPSINANGAEDALTSAPTAVRALARVADLSCDLSAIELLVAAQAVELRGTVETLGPPLARVQAGLRALSAPIGQDRPLGGDITRVARALKNRALVAG